MKPGTYLQKRRLVAGVTLADAAFILGTPAHSTRAPSQRERRRLVRKLTEVEASADYLTPSQAHLLKGAFSFDADIYEQLVDLDVAPEGSDLPRPQICRSCGCSYFDPCIDPRGANPPCAWTSDPELCTSCVSAIAIAAGEEPNAAASVDT